MYSNLTEVTVLSPNCNKPRKYQITRLTPHIMVGNITAKRCGEIFADKARMASANYGIGKDGEVGCYVEEENRSWCSGNRNNDERAITIECASNTKKPYKVNDKVYEKLVLLCTDIVRRQGFKEVVFRPKNDYTVEELNGTAGHMIITVHRWFQATECCGDYLFAKLPDLARTINTALENNVSRETFPQLWKVKISNLYIRELPTTESRQTGITGSGVFTIVDKKGDWGLLKSGAGWIYLGDSRWTERRA